eukprot:3187555-Ditylum_brightwellii.AAC.1
MIGTKTDNVQATAARMEEKATTHPTKRTASVVEREKGTEINSDVTKKGALEYLSTEGKAESAKKAKVSN